jgi:hypothetical protein
MGGNDPSNYVMSSVDIKIAVKYGIILESTFKVSVVFQGEGKGDGSLAQPPDQHRIPIDPTHAICACILIVNLLNHIYTLLSRLLSCDVLSWRESLTGPPFPIRSGDRGVLRSSVVTSLPHCFRKHEFPMPEPQQCVLNPV